MKQEIFQNHWMDIEKRLIKYQNENEMVYLVFFLIYYRYICHELITKNKNYTSESVDYNYNKHGDFITYLELNAPLFLEFYPNHLQYISLLKAIKTPTALQGNISFFNEIINKLDQTLLSDFFNYIVEAKAKSLGGYHTLPSPLNELMARVLLTEIDSSSSFSVYNPTIGFGKSLISLNLQNNEKIEFYGQDINKDISLLGEMNLIVAGYPNAKILNQDVFSNEDLTPFFGKNQFNYIISSPPIEQRDSRERNFEIEKYISYIIDHLADKGKAVVLIPTEVLISNRIRYVELRRNLIDNKYLTGIINLKAGLSFRNSKPTSIIILEKNNKQNTLFSIEAYHDAYYKGNYQQTEFSTHGIDEIINLWKQKSDSYLTSINISYNLISETDYTLNIRKYLKYFIEIPDGYTKYKLRDLIYRINGQFYTAESKKSFEKAVSISYNTLTSDPFSDLDFNNNKKIAETNLQAYRLYETNCIITNLKGFRDFKFGYLKKINKNVIANPNFTAFKVNEALILPEYLLLKFTEPSFIEQFNRAQTGTNMPIVSLNDFLDIELAIPNVTTQENIYHEAKTENDKFKIKEFKLQSTIDALLKEQTVMSQWKLHDLRNGPLLQLIGAVNELNIVSEKQAEIFKTPILANQSRLLKDVVNDVFEAANKISEELSNLYELKNTLTAKEKIPIVKTLQTFFSQKKTLIGNLAYIDLQVLDSLKEYHAYFNKKEFEMVLENIFDNAKRHGNFISEDDGNKFKLDVTEKENGILSIKFLNTGTPSTIDSFDYFTEGYAFGLNKNTGKGGFIIKTLVEKNGATVIQTNYDPQVTDGFVFGIELQLNYLDENE